MLAGCDHMLLIADHLSFDSLHRVNLVDFDGIIQISGVIWFTGTGLKYVLLLNYFQIKVRFVVNRSYQKYFKNKNKRELRNGQ